MGLFNFFKKSNSANNSVSEQPEQEKIPEIRKEDFIDETPPNKNNDSVIIRYGTGMPIDLIYGYLREDYETKGYDDALSNPDTSYKEMNKAIIKSDLRIKFNQVRLKYEDDLRNVEFHIASRSQAGLVDLVNQLNAEKERLQHHMDELNRMEDDFNNEKPYMVGMLLSYERGFMKGLAALSLQEIKNITNNEVVD